MRKRRLIILTAMCVFLVNMTCAQTARAGDASGVLPGEGTPPASLHGEGTPTGDLGGSPTLQPPGGAKSSGLLPPNDDTNRGSTPLGPRGGSGTSSRRGMLTGVTPWGDIPDTGRSSDDIAIEKRVTALESSKQDLSVWITLFVAIVTLLIAANVGLSVWQAGSIARNQVEESIKNYDKEFHGILSKDAQSIDDQIKSYESKLLVLTEKLDQHDSSSTKKIEQMNETLSSYRNETNNILSKFQSDSENLKESTLNEIENYYLKKIQDLDSMLNKKRGSDEKS